MRTVVYHPKVPAEVRAFLDHYDAISSDLGDSFWQELTDAIEYAQDHPETAVGADKIGDGAFFRANKCA